MQHRGKALNSSYTCQEKESKAKQSKERGERKEKESKNKREKWCSFCEQWYFPTLGNNQREAIESIFSKQCPHPEGVRPNNLTKTKKMILQVLAES